MVVAGFGFVIVYVAYLIIVVILVVMRLIVGFAYYSGLFGLWLFRFLFVGLICGFDYFWVCLGVVMIA